MTNDELWYKSAIFYQIYVRAFYDSNGDGHGDLKGLTSRLGYLQDLGVDCIWLMPIYPSPLKDDAYDIADYYNIAEPFGTLDDLRSLLHEGPRLNPPDTIPALTAGTTPMKGPTSARNLGSSPSPSASPGTGVWLITCVSRGAR